MRASRFIVLLVAALPARAGASTTNAPVPGVRWHAATGRHDAMLPGWPIDRVLGRLAAGTGWRVLVEPGIRAEVRTSFTGLSTREALPRILGGLNFTLTAATNGISTLRVFRTSASSAAEEIAADRGGVIGDELIVRLRKPGAVDAALLAAQTGGTITGTNGAALRLKFDSDAAAVAAKAALEANADVAAVENNLEFAPPETPVAVAAAALPPLGLNPTVNPDGSKRVIALVDTAVQPLAPEFQSFLLPGVDIVPGARPSTDPTHGTSMAEAMVRGLAAGSADGLSTTRIRPYDVYGPNDSASTWDVARAVTQAVQDGATIINLSLGSIQDSPYLRDVVSSVTAQGALVIAAAGNDSSPAPFYPAAYDSALAVTASSVRGGLAGYANFGSFVDIAAPGATYVSLNGASWMVQGTSVSSAFASGVAGGMARDAQAPLGTVRLSLTSTFPFQSRRGP